MGMVRIAAYTIRIMGKDVSEYASSKEFDDTNQEVVDGLGELMDTVASYVSDDLPEGFYCKIER